MYHNLVIYNALHARLVNLNLRHTINIQKYAHYKIIPNQAGDRVKYESQDLNDGSMFAGRLWR